MKHVLTILWTFFLPMAALAITINGSVVNPTCGACNGSIVASVTGGTPPYAYYWAPVPGGGQGTPNVSGLCAGSYAVTVTDANAEVAMQNFTLTDQQLGDVTYTAITYVYDQSAAHHPCIGGSDGSFRVILSQLGGVPPYTITANGMPPIGYDMFTNDPYFGYFSSNEVISVNITDANGCQGGASVAVDGPSPVPFSADNVNPSCGGLANGSVDLTFGFSGPYGPALSIIGPGGNVYNDTPFSEPLGLTALLPGTYTVVRNYDPVYFAGPCQFIEQFTIPDLGVACGTVSGDLFIDNDQDCAQGGAEPSVPYRVIVIDPGPEYAITDGTGHYTRNLANGNYNLAAQGTGTDLFPICPPVQPVNFTINNSAAIIDLADSSLVQLDVSLSAANTPARVGSGQSIWGHVSNLSAQLSGAVTLTCTFDPALSFINASPTPSDQTGNTITWSFPSMSAYASFDFSVQLQVPADVGLIGQAYAHVFNVSQPNAESSNANNTSTLSGTITAAYDPNDKTARTSTGWSDVLYYSDQDEWIDYTIRFQNTGNDTAFNISITDTLIAQLDMATFEQGVASHPFSVTFRNDRTVEWRFQNILLPDSATNEPASHGLVAFRIRPVGGLLPSTMISNTANIYFDSNPPVITEPSVLVVEQSTNVAQEAEGPIRLWPNPANSSITVPCNVGSLPLVFDMSGRAFHLPFERHNGNVIMDVRDLPRGIYAVRAGMGTGRFVKQ